MPGFVDVTGWTSEEVRRMGHADDYDDVDFQPRRKFVAPTRINIPKYTIGDAWAAACAAHRINGGYFKEVAYNWDETAQIQRIAKRKNRDIMMEFLADPTQLTVDDIERGEYCRDYLQSDLTFRTLKNKVGEFDNALRKVLAITDTFDSYHHKYELAILACLPASEGRSEIRQNSENRVQFAKGGYIGKEGDKIDLEVEVLNSNYSKQYNIYWVRAITAEDQAVFFSSKEAYDPGTHLAIKGTVKAHKDNLTQLSRVKVL